LIVLIKPIKTTKIDLEFVKILKKQNKIILNDDLQKLVRPSWVYYPFFIGIKVYDI